MKTFVLVLALVAVALAAPADDSNQKKPEKIREKSNTEYDAYLKFNWKGDGSWKNKIEAAFKPIVDVLNAFGLKGDLDSESNGQSGGDVSGHFRLAGKRGNGTKLSDGPSQSSGSDANIEASPSNGSKSGRNGLSSVVDAGQGVASGVSVPQVPSLPNLPVAKSGRSAIPQFG